MADMYDGTHEGLIEFFTWAARKGEMSKPTANNLRGAAQKVLAIDLTEENSSVDVRTVDVDRQFERFQRLNASQYSTSSMEAYRQRFRQAVEIYQAFLSGEDWTKKAPATRSSSSGSKTSKPKSAGQDGQLASVSSMPEVTTTAAVTMIDYPFPLRPGVRARLSLPEDMSKAEASRVAAFISTLAVDQERLAITSGGPSAVEA